MINAWRRTGTVIQPFNLFLIHRKLQKIAKNTKKNMFGRQTGSFLLASQCKRTGVHRAVLSAPKRMLAKTRRRRWRRANRSCKINRLILVLKK
jgi:hypothetical protein